MRKRYRGKPPITKHIFVFSSNPEGHHKGGDAKTAFNIHGAITGCPIGLQNNCYAIVAKELRSKKEKITLPFIHSQVKVLLDFAAMMPNFIFNVTEIGCEKRGFKPAQIAPIFRGHPPNVHLPVKFRVIVNRRTG